MRNEFYNHKQKVSLVFTEESVSFINPQQEYIFPYGAIDTAEMSILGVFQVTHRSTVCTFTVERGEKAKLKEMLKYTKDAMKSAPEAEPKCIDLTKAQENSGLSKEEQLKKCKQDFIQGRISKEEYEAVKRQLK